MAKKGLFSIQNIVKHYFQSYFDGKQIKKKITVFYQKHGLTPLKKMRFLSPRKTKIFMAKKGFFSIQNIIKHYFQSYFDGKQITEKITVFDQKHGLTPLEKCDFWDFERLKFSRPKKVCFLSRTLLNIISSLILRENK